MEPQVIGLSPDQVAQIIDEHEATAKAALTEDFWDELDSSVGQALVPALAPQAVAPIEKIVVKDLESWVKASSPLPRKELLEIRVNQERWYVLFTAQQVADGIRVVSEAKELSDLNRLGRSYFGSDFATLVAECIAMTEHNQEQANEHRHRPEVA